MEKLINGCGGSGSITKLYLLFTGKPPSWQICCDMHDLAYSQGGDEATRAWADGLLRDCVAKTDNVITAWIVWAGVRLGGKSHWTYT